MNKYSIYLKDFLAFQRAAYFRILFVVLLLVPFYFTYWSLTAITVSEPLAEYIKDFADFHDYKVQDLPSRLAFVILADLMLVVAGALLLQLMRSFLLFNAASIEAAIALDADAIAAERSRYLSTLFNTVVMAIIITMLLMPHIAYSWTLLSKITPPENSLAATGILGGHIRRVSLAINLGAALLSCGLYIVILRGHGKFLEQRTLVVFAFFAVVAFAMHVLVYAAPVAISAKLGPFGMIIMFYAVITMLLASFLYSRALLPLIGFALSLQLSNLLVPYATTRQLARSSPPPTDLTTYGYASKFFYERAPRGTSDCSVPRAPMPVFIVTAEGGGLYAAYFSALVLSQLHARNPGFSKQIYAMSGVSGGGLGVSLFAKALNKSGVSVSKVVETFFKEDFLGPVIGSMAFVDSRQIIGSTSASRHRAYAMERSFEAAWDNAVGSRDDTDGFETDMLSLREGEIPVVLNAVVINNGLPLLISPIRLGNAPPRTQLNSYAQYQDLVGSRLRTSTAVALSARFPFVTPTGLLVAHGSSGQPLITVGDGGYFDNTGMVAGIMLADDLQANLAELRGSHRDCDLPQVKIIILRLRASLPLRPTDKILPPPDESLAPLYALYNVRTVQRDQLKQLAELKKYEVVDLPLFDQVENIALTWYLSVSSKLEISRRVSALMAKPMPAIDGCCEP